MDELTLQQRIEKFSKEVERSKGAKESLDHQIRTTKKNLEDLDEKMGRLKAAVSTLTDVAKKTSSGHEDIEAFVAAGLRYVWDDDTIEVSVPIEMKRGHPSPQFLVSRKEGKHQVTAEIGTGHGRGMVEVSALLFRAAVLVAHPDAESTLIIDDPISRLPSTRLKRLAHVLRWISEEIQILYTSTVSEIFQKADKFVWIGEKDDGTVGVLGERKGS